MTNELYEFISTSSQIYFNLISLFKYIDTRSLIAIANDTLTKIVGNKILLHTYTLAHVSSQILYLMHLFVLELISEQNLILEMRYKHIIVTNSNGLNLCLPYLLIQIH